MGLCKMPGSCPMALGNFQCRQGLWANPSQAQTWGRNRVETQEKDPAPLPWGCGGFQGKKWGIIGLKNGIKMTPVLNRERETKPDLRAPGLPG